MLITPPLSLYIHFPWCLRKCPYCDFNSYTLQSNLPEAAYIDALIADLKAELSKIQNRPIISIFMGGGTPSLFSSASINKCLETIQCYVNFDKSIEVTLEVNPSTVEYERFAGFYAAGVNRLSIGVQSFQEEKLKALGRTHQAQEAVQAIETAKAVGFANFNLDLMHGLPQQNLSDSLFDLQTALALEPTHLSWYQLTIEPNTFFDYQPPVLPDLDDIWTIQDHGTSLLAQNGFVAYEISAYSRPNYFCVHNKNYWEFGDYLGIGAGAHSKITDVNRQAIIRSYKEKNPKDYLKKECRIKEEKILSKESLAFEFMLNRLRLYEAIPVAAFEQRTGLSLATIEKKLEKAAEQELLTWNNKIIHTTDLGKRFYTQLVSLFLE